MHQRLPHVALVELEQDHRGPGLRSQDVERSGQATDLAEPPAFGVLPSGRERDHDVLPADAIEQALPRDRLLELLGDALAHGGIAQALDHRGNPAFESPVGEQRPQ